MSKLTKIMFSCTIRSRQHFLALYSECVKLGVDFKYRPCEHLFTAFPIVDSDRNRLININNQFYV